MQGFGFAVQIVQKLMENRRVFDETGAVPKNGTR